MNNDFLKRFLDYLSVEKGLSANTIASYQRDLSRYLGQIKGKSFDSIRQADIVSYLTHLASIGISPVSAARSLSAVRGFHKYLMTDGLVHHDPTENLETPRGWKRLPRTLSLTEVDSLLSAPDCSTPLGLRDKAMLELLYATGLRVSELVGLGLAHVNLERGFLVVMGKGSKERVVPMGDSAIAAVRGYLSWARAALLKSRTSGPAVHKLAEQGYNETDVLGTDQNIHPQDRHHEEGISPICCATPLQPISLTTAPIFGPYRPCWATRTYRRPRSILMFPGSGSGRFIEKYHPRG